MAEVSIIVPVYQVEKYIRQCVDSILAQTFTDFELILVDDGSKDQSGKICDEYARMDTRVKVIHQKNSGVAAARNHGIACANGSYLCFVDADDWIENTMIMQCLSQIKENDADMAVCGFERIDLDSGKVVGRDMTGYGNSVKEITPKDDFMVFVNPAPWNKIYKREKIKD